MIALNASTGTVITAVWLKRSPGSVGEPSKVESHALQPGSQPDPNLPWFENAGSSAGLRFAASTIRIFGNFTCLQKPNVLLAKNFFLQKDFFNFLTYFFSHKIISFLYPFYIIMSHVRFIQRNVSTHARTRTFMHLCFAPCCSCFTRCLSLLVMSRLSE